MISNKTTLTGLFILSSFLSGGASVDNVNSAINQISGGIFLAGSGNRLYITFRSGLASHATAAYTRKLFENMKSVVEGTT